MVAKPREVDHPNGGLQVSVSFSVVSLVLQIDECPHLFVLSHIDCLLPDELSQLVSDGRHAQACEASQRISLQAMHFRAAKSVAAAENDLGSLAHGLTLFNEIKADGGMVSQSTDRCNAKARRLKSWLLH
jgi:hypothetical protein